MASNGRKNAPAREVAVKRGGLEPPSKKKVVLNKNLKPVCEYAYAFRQRARTSTRETLRRYPLNRQRPTVFDI